jgi:hypothetical protein
MVREGHAVRVTTRGEAGSEPIERAGAECWTGTPDRLATLRGALDGVTLACWLLARAAGEPEQLRALHGSRLELFVRQLIDTPVRGLIYDAGAGTVPEEVLAGGADIVRALAALNAIPVRVLSGPADEEEGGWLERARAAVEALLGGRA